MIEEIDFVLPWVDASDPKWQDDFYRYKNIIGDKRIIRFRDIENLKYLFRAFDEFTPWVNKIYFITYGHIPSWLDKNNPKLVIVKHEDFMKKENLPIFNSHAIEVNLHRINGLNEKFVYFNDDTFILKKIEPSIFFKNNLPVNVAISNVMHEGDIAHIIVNNIRVINKHTKKQKHKIIFSNFNKWFYPGYGFKVIRTLLLLAWSRFTGFKEYHHPQPFLKKTYIDLWSQEEELLNNVSKSKFRVSSDINQYLFKYWQFIKGDFYPDTYNNAYNKRKYKNIKTKKQAESVSRDLDSGKYEMYCVNDTFDNISEEDYDAAKKILNISLNNILPNKSSFEL